MTLTELNRAYVVLTHCIDQYISTHDVKFSVSEIAPSNYKRMIEYRSKFGHFLVSSEGDHGLLGKEYNIKFRAVHDHGHYTLGLNFSVKDELELSEHSAYEFRSIAKGLGFEVEADNVYKIIEAEVKEQRLYYARTGQYVADQAAFIKYLLLD